MWQYQLSFDHPWYLALLVLLPLMWWFSFRSLAGLGSIRRAVAIILRSLVFTLIILALAEVNLVRTSDRLTVIFLLDQSLSIPADRREAMIEYTNQAIDRYREENNKTGVIVFGREAAIEIPPFDDDIQVPQAIESALDPEYTNLAAALKLAQASFPEDAAKRIVVISDGNQNVGDALEQAGIMADTGIGIDVVPVFYHSGSEVSVEKVSTPSDVRVGQPFDVRVVLNNSAEPTSEDNGEVQGTLRVTRSVEGRPQTVTDQPISLPPGKHVLTVRQELDQPSFYTFEARFLPEDRNDDRMSQNNRATNFTYIRGSGQVLFIEDHLHRGEFDLLVERLREQELEVSVRPTNQLFTNLAELQPYDTVILANVPRELFTDEQIDMLVRNTEQMGAGVIMLGGPNSFGAGGWTNTELEKAMPLDFQIRNPKVVPKGALALLMHASEIARGNHWQNVIAREAIKALGPQDYCGLLHWGNMGEEWLWLGQSGHGMIPVGPNRDKMLGRLSRMTPGDMPDFNPSLIMARKAFSQLPDSGIRHMIIISDGDPTPPTPAVVTGLINAKVTVTTVAVGAHGPAGHVELQKLATATGGKYYKVNQAKALPKIFQREARRVARPLIFEKQDGFNVAIRYPHEMISGVEEPIPPLTGFVMTTVKANPLVEVELVAEVSEDEANNTILASWTYGAGRAVCFTSDAGARWANSWTTWDGYDKLFGQMVRWSMRPVGQEGNYSLATDVESGKVRVVVTALDKEDEFLNFLNLSGAVVGPDMQPLPLRLDQTAPGRYIGEFDATDAGNYFITLSPGAGQAPIRAGVNVPYSAEFRDRTTDEPLLEMLAGMQPVGGEQGVVVESGTSGNMNDAMESWLATNVFRPGLAKAESSQGIWYLLVFVASCLFFGDVLIRRVSMSLTWIPPLAGKLRDRLLGREPAPAATQYMDRLRSSKEQVSERIEKQRAAARFEPSEEALTSTEVYEELPEVVQKKPAPKPTGGGIDQPQAEEEGYTSRLLKAKKKVWEDRKKD